MEGVVEIHTRTMREDGSYSAYDRKSLVNAIARVKSQRNIYKTQEAYDINLAEFEGALVYLDEHIAPSSATREPKR